MVRGREEEMKTTDELRKLNNELIEELEAVKAQKTYMSKLYRESTEKRDKLEVKVKQLEGVIDELTDEIDGLIEHLGQESDSQLKEQNRLLRQVLKGVL